MNIEKILEYYKIPIEDYLKNGEVLCFCPFHEGTSGEPRLQVNIESDIFYCWSCNAGGNAVQFIMLMEKVDDYEMGKTIFDHIMFGDYNVDILKKRFLNIKVKDRNTSFETLRKELKNVMSDKIINFYDLLSFSVYFKVRRIGKDLSRRFQNSEFFFLSYNHEIENRLQYYDYVVNRLDSLFYRCENVEMLYSFYKYFLKEMKCLGDVK